MTSRRSEWQIALYDFSVNCLLTAFRTLHREEEVVGFFLQYYGGADNKQGLRPLVDAIEQCDTLLRYDRIYLLVAHTPEEHTIHVSQQMTCL